MPRTRARGGSARKRGGGQVLLQPANFTGPIGVATSSPFGRVKGHGCPGTTCNKAAAAGVYSPGCWRKGRGGGRRSKQSGGTSLECLGSAPLSDQSQVLAPFRGGHPTVTKCPNELVSNPLAMKGGRRRRRRTRKRRTRKRRTRKRRTRKRRCLRCRPVSCRSAGHRRRRTKARRRRRYRGGAPQGYSNVPLSYGYSLGAPLTSGESALASPPPQHVYDHCKPGARPIPGSKLASS